MLFCTPSTGLAGYSRHVFSKLIPTEFFTAILVASALIGTGSAMAGQSTACPTALLNRDGNICTAADVSVATALVGVDQSARYCMPGETALVNIAGTVTMRKNSRWDIGIFVSSDGKDIKTFAADGGAAVCEVVPLPPIPRQRDGAAVGEAPVMGSFDNNGGQDQCGDVAGLNNGDMVSNIPLTVNGGTFNGPISLTCVAGPSGKLSLQSVVSWNQTDPGVCDPTDSASYDLTQISKCSANVSEVDIDIVGRLIIQKAAPGGGLNNFDFTYSNDSVPQFADLPGPTDPFTLQDGGSAEIWAEIGTGPATIIVEETNLPANWQLDNISCTGDDVDAVVVANNQITVTLSYDATTPTDSQDDVVCTYGNILVTPELTLDKTTSTPNYDDPNDTISYSYAVSNTGNVALAFPVTVSDSKATVTCPANDGGAPNNGDAILDPGESIVCTATYDVTQADINAGSVTNLATASADGVQSQQDSVTVNAVQTVTMTVVKTSPTASVTGPGTVSYSYLVTNTGNVTLTGISLTDDNDQDDMNCPATSLAPGANMICTATHSVTQGEIDANGSPVADSGNLTNTVTATSSAPTVQDTLNIPIALAPSLGVLKTGTWNDDGAIPNIAEVGETISYVIATTNTGNTTLLSVAVTDPLITAPPNNGLITCPGGNPIPSLAPAASVNCTATYTLVLADINAGSRSNTATATSGNTSGQGSDNVLLPNALGLSLVKTGTFNDDTTADGFAEAGETIGYTFDVTNNSAIAVTNVSVTDPKVASITCPGGNPFASLGAGATVRCTGSYVLSQGDVDAGQVDNTATADSAETEGTTDDETVPLVQNIDWTITKTGTFNDDITDDGLAQPGETIGYVFAVQNTGFVTLTNVMVTDPKVSPIDCTPENNPIASIAPGVTIPCTGSYVITQSDIDAGQVTNTGTGDPDETPPDTSTEITDLPQLAAMTVEKSSATTQVGAPVPVLYSYLVTNTGNVTLNGIALGDDNDEDDLSCPSTSLAPGEFMTCSASHDVTQGEIDADGSPIPGSGVLANTVTGTATELQEPVTDSLEIPISPDASMTVQKSSPTTEITAAGPVTYNYLVTNTGSVTLTVISLADDNVDVAVDCGGITTLDPGADMQCTATHTVTQDELTDGGSPVPGSGSLVNVVTASSAEAEDATDTLSIPINYSETTSFRVTKDFSDDNDALVKVNIKCNTGLPLESSFMISEFNGGVNFVVNSFEAGTMNCEITEELAPAGYTVSFLASAGEGGVADSITSDGTGCYFEGVVGGTFNCTLTNRLDEVELLVYKEWLGDLDDLGGATSLEASANYQCFNVLDAPDGTSGDIAGDLFFDGNDVEAILLYPSWAGDSWCDVEEVNVESGVEYDDSECSKVPVTPGNGGSCTIYNSMFFEGIPALSRNGLLILVLLMLGAGAVGLRRFV